jgi:hypothetical protein
MLSKTPTLIIRSKSTQHDRKHLALAVQPPIGLHYTASSVILESLSDAAYHQKD